MFAKVFTEYKYVEMNLNGYINNHCESKIIDMQRCYLRQNNALFSAFSVYLILYIEYIVRGLKVIHNC